MAIKGFAFTKIIVADLAAMEKFYVDGLGLGVVTRIAVDETGWSLDETILSIGEGPGTHLNLLQYRNQPAPPTGEAVVGLAVEDIESVVAMAVAAGGKVTVPVQDVPGHAMRLAYVADPEGHLIELVEPLAA
ncbi:MAG: VOC family protein [Novosphingobium sp.]|nr:VOC family protein [Novosphingobium sp.]